MLPKLGLEQHHLPPAMPLGRKTQGRPQLSTGVNNQITQLSFCAPAGLSPCWTGRMKTNGKIHRLLQNWNDPPPAVFINQHFNRVWIL